jgi:integrase
MPSRSRRYTRGPHITQRAGIYYAYLPGKHNPVSLGTRDRAEADRKFRAILGGRLQPGGAASDPQEITIVELVEEYLASPHGWTKETRRTARARALAYDAWAEGRGIVHPAQITKQVLDDWIKERQTQVSRRTINRDLRVLKLMVAWGSDSHRQLCAKNDAIVSREYLREPHRHERHVVPSPTEMRRIFESVTHQGALIALKALYVTGLRIAELQRLTIFDLHDGAVHVRPQAGAADSAAETKGYRERRIALHPEALEIVRRFLAWRSGRGRGGRRIACHGTWLLRILKDGCDRAEVDRCGLHDLRRAFATESARAGVSVLVISQWLGHADVRTTELYLAAYRSDKSQVAPIPAGILHGAGFGGSTVGDSGTKKEKL